MAESGSGKSTPPTRGKGSAVSGEDRRKGVIRLSGALGGLTRRAFGRRGFLDPALVTGWAELVGPALASQCDPIRITFPSGSRRDGTLVIRASSSLALELQHLAPQVIDRVNRLCGYGAVARLKFVNGQPVRRESKTPGEGRGRSPAPRLSAPEPVHSPEGFGNPELAEALGRLGARIDSPRNSRRKE